MSREIIDVCPECGDAVEQEADGLWGCTSCDWFGEEPDHFEGDEDDATQDLRGEVPPTWGRW